MNGRIHTSDYVCVDPHRRCYSHRTFGIPRSCMTRRRLRMPPIETMMEPSRCMQTARKPEFFLRGDSEPRRWVSIPPPPETVHLPIELLRTCRQIYHEMSHIVYSANTFSFQDPTLLTRFASHLGSQALAIRHLHLHISVSHKVQEDEWNLALRTVAQRFSNLCSLDIGIDQALWNRWGDGDIRDRKTPSMSKRNTFLTGLSNFKKSRFLQTMTIVVTDKYPWEAWKHCRFLWSTAQKQKWAQDVRADILNGDKA